MRFVTAIGKKFNALARKVIIVDYRLKEKGLFSQFLRRLLAVFFVMSKIYLFFSQRLTNRLFALWCITNSCNFNCKYCFKDRRQYTAKPINDIQKVIRVLKKAGGKRWNIVLTGGEPFLCPDFIELCEELTKEFRIGIQTNLTAGQAIREFATRINPGKVNRIIAAVHIEEREKAGSGIDSFIENFLLLEKRGFVIKAMYVLHPALIQRFKRDFDFFNSRGIKLLIKPFKGTYNGRAYPEQYSNADKELILGGYADAFFYPFYSEGLMCNAGKTLVRIHEDGTVTRCVEDMTVIGNIYEGIKLSCDAAPCRVGYCPCSGYGLISVRDFLSGIFREQKSFECRKPALRN